MKGARSAGLILQAGDRELPLPPGRRKRQDGGKLRAGGWWRLRVTRLHFRKPGCQGLTLGMENGQLDPLSQLLCSRESH